MSMTAPSYYDNEAYKEWYDFENDCFKEGAPQWLIDMVCAEDEDRKRKYDEALKEGILL